MDRFYREGSETSVQNQRSENRVQRSVGQNEFEVDERIFFVDHLSDLTVTNLCVKGTGSGCGVEGIETDGICGPIACGRLGVFHQKAADSLALVLGVDGVSSVHRRLISSTTGFYKTAWEKHVETACLK